MHILENILNGNNVQIFQGAVYLMEKIMVFIFYD